MAEGTEELEYFRSWMIELRVRFPPPNAHVGTDVYIPDWLGCARERTCVPRLAEYWHRSLMRLGEAIPSKKYARDCHFCLHAGLGITDTVYNLSLCQEIVVEVPLRVYQTVASFRLTLGYSATCLPYGRPRILGNPGID